MRHNKYLYILVIQFKYPGMSWEDVCEYQIHQSKQASKELKEYRLSGGGSYRLINRRVDNSQNLPVMPIIEKTSKGYKLGNTRGVSITRDDMWILSKYSHLMHVDECITFAELSQRIVNAYDVHHDNKANYAARWLKARAYGIKTSVYDVAL